MKKFVHEQALKSKHPDTFAKENNKNEILLSADMLGSGINSFDSQIRESFVTNMAN